MIEKLFLNSSTENDAAAKGLDYITNLMMIYRWKEKVYLRDAASEDFAKLARPLYAKILEFEAGVLVHKNKPPAQRLANNLFPHTSWSDFVDAIRLLDESCTNLTNAIADVRANNWREEEQKWHEKLYQQPRQAKEKENIRKLYSNYEAQKNLNPERIMGTCGWFLNHTNFLVWRKSQSSSLLWPSADPGCGKSVLSKHLIDRHGEVLTTNNEIPTVCYFFFKETDVSRKDGSKAIRAFLHQLVMQQPWLYRYLEEDFENKSDAFLSDINALWALFVKAATHSSSREVICVLDALDECEAISRRVITAKILRLFSCRFGDSGKPALKMIVTSRPEFRIERDFKLLTRSCSEVRLRGEDESDHIGREIDIVIHHKVSALAQMMGLSTADQTALVKNLTKSTHRTYLWLYLIFDDIESRLSFNSEDISSISSTVPRNVKEAYTAILQKSTDKEAARKLLRIVLAASRPLTLDEVNVAMHVREYCKSYGDL